MDENRGLLIGRMQPVHNGHISVIQETLKEVERKFLKPNIPICFHDITLYH